MKLYVMVFLFFSLTAAYSGDLPEINYTWSEIKLPSDEDILRIELTGRNELFIFGSKNLYYSLNYGKELTRISYGFNTRLYGYLYDSKGGIYFITDDSEDFHDFYNVYYPYIDILYIPPSRDTILSHDNGEWKGDIKKEYYLEEDTNYVTNYFPNLNYLIDDNNLLIGTNKEVFIYNFPNNKYEKIKYFDDILQYWLKKDSLFRFELTFLKYETESKRIDAFLLNGPDKLHIYSSDLGKNWDTLSVNINCKYHFINNFNSYAQFNRNNKWLFYDTWDKRSILIDDNCNYKEVNFPILYGWDIVDFLNQRKHFNGNYFAAPADTGKIILLSNNLFEDFFIINSVPYNTDSLMLPYPNTAGTGTYISSDGHIVVYYYFYNYNTGYKSRRLYFGAPTTSVDDNLNFVENLLVFPNPASDYITINIGSIGASSNGNNIWASPNASIDIYDVMGVLIHSTPSASQPPLNEGNLRIDVSNLSSGVYFVKIGDKVEKFVKY